MPFIKKYSRNDNKFVNKKSPYEISLQNKDLLYAIGFFEVDQDFLDTIIHAKIKDKDEEVIQAWEQLKLKQSN